jgi:hypothetical protein
MARTKSLALSKTLSGAAFSGDFIANILEQRSA